MAVQFGVAGHEPIVIEHVFDHNGRHGARPLTGEVQKVKGLINKKGKLKTVVKPW